MAKIVNGLRASMWARSFNSNFQFWRQTVQNGASECNFEGLLCLGAGERAGLGDVGSLGGATRQGVRVTLLVSWDTRSQYPAHLNVSTGRKGGQATLAFQGPEW